MFDQFRNLSQLTGLLQRSGEIRERLEEIREELKTHRIEAETGGGAVKAVVSGAMKVVSIDIDPHMLGTLVDPGAEEDRQLASELVVGAVNAAMEKAQRHAAEEMQRQMSDLDLPLPPGMDLDRLMKGLGGPEA